MTVYRAIAYLAGPFVLAIWAMNKNKRPMRERFSPPKPVDADGPVWVHACSVGEVEVARILLDRFAVRWPDLPFVVTASTPAGLKRAIALFDRRARYAPAECPPVVNRFFEVVRPRALILIETELWPLMLERAHRRQTPVAIVNGRISDRSLRRYTATRWFFRPLTRPVQCVAAQSDEHARRFAAIGVTTDRIAVSGNLKFDASISSGDEEANRTQFRNALGLPRDALVVVFGSTRPGDEDMAAACWRTLAPRYPSLRFVVAPRHLDRARQARNAFQGIEVRMRTEDAPETDAAPVLVLDTHGELRDAYAAADIAVIGGSFSEEVQGHNPIESAALGVPTVFGPHMKNFADAADTLLSAGGVVRADSRDDIAPILDRFLRDPDTRRTIGDNAVRAVTGQKGATGRTLDAVAALLDPGSARSE